MGDLWITAIFKGSGWPKPPKGLCAEHLPFHIAATGFADRSTRDRGQGAVGEHFLDKRRLSPSDKKYQQAFSRVFDSAFDVPASSPDWAADLLAKIDDACAETIGDLRPAAPHSRQVAGR